VKQLVLGFLLLVVSACEDGLALDARVTPTDGGDVASDGGVSADGGDVASDGGVSADGGGVASDGGISSDGGGTSPDGGRPDAGANPSCVEADGICYVAVTGSDANGGTVTQPFASIGHCARALTGRSGAGSCVVRGGDYREKVQVPSGLTIEAYSAAGTPERVSVRGTERVTNLDWAQVRTNVWRAAMNLSSSARRFEPQLAVGDVAFVEARWPNIPSFEGLLDRSFFSSALAGTTSNHLTSSALPPNLVGAVVLVVGGLGYGAHTGLITNASASALDYTPDQGTTPIPAELTATPGSHFFIANTDGLLDAPGEWFYDANAKTIELFLPSGTTPASVEIEVKMRDYAFDLAGTRGATLKNLRLFMASIHMDEASADNVLKGLHGAYLSHNLRNLGGPWDGAMFATASSSTGLEISGNRNTLEGSFLKYSSGHGISVFGNSHTIQNNRVYFTDYSSTGGFSLNIGPNTSHHQILRNTFRTTGRSGLGMIGGGGSGLKSTVIAYNDIVDFGRTTEDLGGMYFSNVDGATPHSGPTITDYTVIHSNHVHDASPGQGTYQGIYFDCSSRGFVISHNVVWNTRGAALQFSTCGTTGGGYYMTVNNNTFGGNQGASVGVYSPSAGGLSNTFISNNIFVESGGICAGASCDPAVDWGAGGSPNFHGDPGFQSGTWLLTPGSAARATAVPVWTDAAFGVDWRCPGGATGCASPVAPSFGAINAGGFEFTVGSSVVEK
jgi:hypothetical protein